MIRTNTHRLRLTLLVTLLAGLPLAARAANPIADFFFPPTDTLYRDSLDALGLFENDLTVKRVELPAPRIDEYRKIVVVHGTLDREWKTVGEYDANLYDLMLRSTQMPGGLRTEEGEAFAMSSDWGSKSLYLTRFRWNGWTLDGTLLNQTPVSLPFDSIKIVRIVKLKDLRNEHARTQPKYYPMDRAGGRLAIMPTAWQPLDAWTVRLNAIYIIPSATLTLPFRTSASVVYQPYDRPKLLSFTTKATLVQKEAAAFAVGTISLGYLHENTPYASPDGANSVGGEINQWSKERFHTSIYGVMSGKWKSFGVTIGAATLPDYDNDYSPYSSKQWRAHLWLGGEFRVAGGMKLLYEAHDEVFNTSQPMKMFNFDHNAWWVGGVRFIFGTVTLDGYVITLDEDVHIPVLALGLTL